MRSCCRLLAPLLGVVLVLLTGGGNLVAQAAGPDCEYAACALRVKGGSLVKGAQEEKVAGLGFRVGDLDDAFAGSPISQELAARFRHRHNVGGLVTWTGLAGVAIGLYWGIQSPDDPAPGVLGLAGFAVAITGAFIRGSGRDHLNRAIWEYNRLVN